MANRIQTLVYLAELYPYHLSCLCKGSFVSNHVGKAYAMSNVGYKPLKYLLVLLKERASDSFSQVGKVDHGNTGMVFL